jgi:hypothetical protein
MGGTSKIENELRSLSTAIEAYYYDHGSYPAMRPLIEHCSYPKKLEVAGGADLFFTEPGKPGLEGLTTPVDYISSILQDPFTDRSIACPYAYFSKGDFWILFSMGYDWNYDIKPREHLQGSPEQIEQQLTPITYDPTNGEKSPGDIWYSNILFDKEIH